MTVLTVLVVALPLLAAVVGLVPPRLLLGRNRAQSWGRPLATLSALIGTGLAALLMVPLWLLTTLAPSWPGDTGFTLVRTGSVGILLGVRVDGLAVTVAALVCVVAFAVQFYSVWYMRDDRRYRSYAAFVSLFTGAMLLVVFSADLIVLLVGWEVMGICSYLLVGHHWERPDFSRAGVKAFLVTKLGDVPFVFGIFALGNAAGSFQIDDVIAAVPYTPYHVLLAGSILLLCGVAGKSAQFPLHTWLPDAMAGPTPVSALIHAATMVAAGAYFVARLYPVFVAVPPALAVLGIVAAVTMLGSALAAFAQDDLKRLLAYSTVSQLAYMQAALAMGGYTAGVTHLLVHGAFKALLFLCAGVVIVRFGTNLMSGMGGAWRAMPVTAVCMGIGYAALVGLPPFAGFFSKDAALDQALEQAMAADPVAPRAVAVLVLVSGLLTVFVTAAYAARAMLLTFFGPRHGEREVKDVHPLVAVPLFVLAAPSIGLGFLGVYRGWLPLWVSGADTGEVAATLPGVVTAVLSFVLLVAGVAVVYFVWVADPARDPVRMIGPLRGAFVRGLGVDALYDLVFVRGTSAVATGVVRLDTDGIDATVRDTGRLAGWVGAVVRRTQTGNAQWYVTCVVVGAVAVAVGAVVLT